MSNMIREIYTKALLAKGMKTTLSTYKITLPNKCDTILGCWIVDHHHQAKIRENQTYSVGSYDVHLWYSYDKNKSEVFVSKITYCDEIVPEKLDSKEINENDETISTCLQEPKCITATIVEEKEIEVELEKIMEISVLGETVIKIEMRDDINQIDPNFIK